MNGGESGRVLAIVGPTASGKSRLGMLIAEKAGGEIVSADSRQLYRMMNIGTAKPSREEQEQIPHHLIDLVNPDESFSAGQFGVVGQRVIRNILASGKIPVVVGGSGLYIDALAGQLFSKKAATAPVREALRRDAVSNPDALYTRLKDVDPEAADRIHPNDTKRIIRALEVYTAVGEPISRLQAEPLKPQYQFQYYGLNWEREVLYARIEARVDQMIDDGLMEEIENLLTLGYDIRYNALDSIGYKELIPYIEGRCSKEEAVTELKKHTRNLAKKQMTWFRRNTSIHWLELTDDSNFTQVAEEVLIHFFRS